MERFQTLESLIARIRGEYYEMPGLRLTCEQACRLWQLDVPTCEMLLEQLMCEGFLYKTRHGSYSAVSSTWSSHAKAQLRRERVPLRDSA